MFFTMNHPAFGWMSSRVRVQRDLVWLLKAAIRWKIGHINLWRSGRRVLCLQFRVTRGWEWGFISSSVSISIKLIEWPVSRSFMLWAAQSFQDTPKSREPTPDSHSPNYGVCFLWRKKLDVSVSGINTSKAPFFPADYWPDPGQVSISADMSARTVTIYRIDGVKIPVLLPKERGQSTHHLMDMKWSVAPLFSCTPSKNKVQQPSVEEKGSEPFLSSETSKTRLVMRNTTKVQRPSASRKRRPITERFAG